MGKTMREIESADTAAEYMDRSERRVSRRAAREVFVDRGAMFQGRTLRQDASGEGVKVSR